MLELFVTFARSFLSFAGSRAAAAAGFVLAGALLEGIGILLIVPFREHY